MLPRKTSEDVVAALLRGLIEQYYPSVFSYINHLTGQRDLAEDIAHRVFLPPASPCHQLLRSSDQRVWLYRRATALARAPTPDCPRCITWPWYQKPQTGEAGKASYRWGPPNMLDQALSALSLQERAVLLLRVHLGFNLADAAAVLGKSQRDTRELLRRAWAATLEIYAQRGYSAGEPTGDIEGSRFALNAVNANKIPGQVDETEIPVAVSHKVLDALLPLYAELGATDRAALDAHVSRCAHCAARIATYRTLERDLARMPEPLHSRRARENLYQAAGRPVDERPAPEETPARRPLPALRFAFIGLVIALTVLLGIWVTGQSRAAQPVFAITGSMNETSAGATPAVAGPEADQLAVSPSSGPLGAASPLPNEPLQSGVPPSAVTWLQQNQMPFDASPPSGNPADLLPIKGIVGDARIVALSDSSSGTQEFAVIKQRMTEFLIQQMGFNTLAIDSSWPQAELLNNYVQNGQGDPEELLLIINGAYRQTTDMLDTVQWLRAHNQDPLGIPRVGLHGFDIMRDYSHIPMDAVVAYLQRVDPAAVPRAYDQNRELFDYLVEHRNEYIAKSSWRDFYSALRNARALLQYDSYVVAGGATQRDSIRNQYLLENVIALLRLAGPGGKVIIWGHNQDLGVNRDERNLGTLLRDRFGAQYVNITLDFYQGAIVAQTARQSGTPGLLATHVVSPPPAGTYEDFLHHAGSSSFILNLRKAPTDNGEAAAWLAGPHLMRTIAGTYNDCRPRDQYIETRLIERFDAMVFVQEVSPATMLFQLTGRVDTGCAHPPNNQDSVPGAEAWQRSATGSSQTTPNRH